jgi:hypothetical protein
MARPMSTLREGGSGGSSLVRALTNVPGSAPHRLNLPLCTLFYHILTLTPMHQLCTSLAWYSQLAIRDESKPSV